MKVKAPSSYIRVKQGISIAIFYLIRDGYIKRVATKMHAITVPVYRQKGSTKKWISTSGLRSRVNRTGLTAKKPRKQPPVRSRSSAGASAGRCSSR